MGSGGSAAKKSYGVAARQVTPVGRGTRHAEAFEEPKVASSGSGSSCRNPSEQTSSEGTDGVGTPLLRRPSGPLTPKSIEAVDPRHERHCVESDISKAFRIRDACAFDDTNKKEVRKRERVWSVGDGVKRNFGCVEVSRLYPQKVYCSVCGSFIVDRAGETLFYFCWRCRRAGRQFLVCIDCHGVGAVGLRQQSRTLPRSRRSPSLSSAHGCAPSLQQNSDSSTKPQHSLNAAIPSGTWAGHFKEGTNRRKAVRELNFYVGGHLAGSCEDGASVAGDFQSGPSYYHVKWMESYQWGQLEVSAQLTVDSPGQAHIAGKFIASDGGKGSLELQWTRS